MFASSINSQLVFFVLIWNRQLGGTSELVFIVPSAHGTMGLQGRSTESLWKWDHGFTCFNQPTTQPTNHSANQPTNQHQSTNQARSTRCSCLVRACAPPLRLPRLCSAAFDEVAALRPASALWFSSLDWALADSARWQAESLGWLPHLMVDHRWNGQKTTWKKMAYGCLWFEARRKMTPQIWSCWRGKGIYEVRQKFGKAQFRYIYIIYIYIYWFYVGQRILQRRPKCYFSVLQL